MDLYDYLKKSKKSLFRFEALQDYQVEEEEKDFQLFIESGKVDLTGMKDWLDFVKSNHEIRIKMQRVRLVRLPLTEYTKFGIPAYESEVKLGEEVRILEEDAEDKTGIQKDFWLIDDNIVIIMKYNQNGKYEGFEVKDSGIEEYLAGKNYLLNNSIPLAEFLSKIGWKANAGT